MVVEEDCADRIGRERRDRQRRWGETEIQREAGRDKETVTERIRELWVHTGRQRERRGEML